jgi:hypothetical protein
MGEKLDPEAKRLRNVSPGELADAEGDERLPPADPLAAGSATVPRGTKLASHSRRARSTTGPHPRGGCLSVSKSTGAPNFQTRAVRSASVGNDRIDPLSSLTNAPQGF